MRARPRSVAVALVLAAAVVAPAAAAPTASGGWSRPVRIERGGRSALDAIASDAHETLVAWDGHSGVWARFLRPGHASTLQRLSATPIVNGGPEVALDARGDAAVAWQVEGHQVTSRGITGFAPGPAYVAYRRAGGRFGAPHLLDRHAQQVSLGIDAVGGVTVAWVRGTPGRLDTAPETLHVTTRRADGRYGNPTTIARGTEFAPALAVNARGDALLAWDDAGAGPRSSIFGLAGSYATRTGSGAFTAPESLVGGHTASFGLTTAMDADGEATVAWEGPWDGSRVGSPFRGIQVQTIDVLTGARGPRQTMIPPAGRTLGDSTVPDVAVAADGAAAIAWVTEPRSSSAPTAIEIARRRPGRTAFAAARRIAAGDAGEQVSLALGPADRLLVAWDRLFDPQLRARLAAGPAAALRSVPSPRPTLQSASGPLAGFSPSGRPQLLWEQHGSGPIELELAQLR
jgi:hypothetical protein